MCPTSGDDWHSTNTVSRMISSSLTMRRNLVPSFRRNTIFGDVQSSSSSKRRRRCDEMSSPDTLFLQTLLFDNENLPMMQSQTTIVRGFNTTVHSIPFLAVSNNIMMMNPAGKAATNRFSTGTKMCHRTWQSCHYSTAILETISSKGQKSGSKRQNVGTNTLQEQTDQVMRFLDQVEEDPYRNQTHRSSRRSHRKTLTSQDCYNILEGWKIRSTQTRDINDAYIGVDFIHKLYDRYAGTHLTPTSLFYDLVLQSLVACDVGTAHEYLLKDIPHEMVTTKGYNIVMNGWAKRGDYHSGMKAQELFDHLVDIGNEATRPEQQQQQLEQHPVTNPLCPNQRTWTILLEAWGKSGHPDASNQIMTLFQMIMVDHRPHRSGQRMLSTNQQKERRSDNKTDIVLINSLLRALVTTFGNRWAAETCELVVRQLGSYDDNNNNNDTSLRPDTQTYSVVLQAWAECEATERMGKAAQSAEDVLRHMMYLYSQHGSNVKPNMRCFTTCIAAWGRAGQPERAERLWHELIDLYQRLENDPQLASDTVAGNAILSAWARSGRSDASIQTKRVLANIMESGWEPNLVSYNCLLDAYSHDGKSTDAVQLLRWLEDNADTHPSLAPDIVSYNTVLNALARDSTLPSAEVASMLLEKLYNHDSSVESVRLDAVSCTAVIRAWGNCKAPSSLDRVIETFQLFLASSADLSHWEGHTDRGPDRVILTAVIQAISNETERHAEALERLVQVLGVPTKYNIISVDGTVFVVAINACLDLTARGSETSRRHNWMKLIFDECCTQGFLSTRILAKLRRSLSHAGFEIVVSRPSHRHQRYPDEWSRNIPRKFRP